MHLDHFFPLIIFIISIGFIGAFLIPFLLNTLLDEKSSYKTNITNSSYYSHDTDSSWNSLDPLSYGDGSSNDSSSCDSGGSDGGGSCDAGGD
ncbi:hypothetical protein ACWATR_28185 [Nostoc sp. UIC 10890]